MKLGELSGNPRNPRKITDERLKMLKKALEQFGDLSGIVFNRRSKQLVGGHQRLKVLPLDAEIIIDRLHETPTKTGTVAEGHITIDEDTFRYREVDWDDATEKAANIAANQHGGDWDYPQLTEWLHELDALNVDLELAGFTHGELVGLMAPDVMPEPEEDPSPRQKKDIECPNCGEKFQHG